MGEEVLGAVLGEEVLEVLGETSAFSSGRILPCSLSLLTPSSILGKCVSSGPSPWRASLCQAASFLVMCPPTALALSHIYGLGKVTTPLQASSGTIAHMCFHALSVQSVFPWIGSGGHRDA